MEQPPATPAAPPELASSGATNIWAKLFNIFAVPGDVFAEIKSRPAAVANWLLPVLLVSALGVATSLVIFSQPNVQQQIREQQAKAMDKQVKAGKMTQAQADRALDFMGPSFMKIAGCIGSPIFTFFRLFWWAFFLWLFGRWLLKTQVEFLKALEVSGLAMMIALLGGIVALLLQMNLDRLMVMPSLALLLPEFDVTRKDHWFMAIVNPFYFWQVGIMALGLAKLAGTSFARAAIPVVGFWLLQESALIMAGLGQFTL
jgi:hypothetical protein